MCGRIVLETTPEQLSLLFDADLAPGVDPCACVGYNIAPTDAIFGIAAGYAAAGYAAAGPAGGRVLDRYRWGMGRPGDGAHNLFNARGETVATKPAFRSAFASRRLIIPVDGFYEWRAGPGRQRQPYFFHRADHRPLALAGLWEPRHSAGGEGAGGAGAGDEGAGGDGSGGADAGGAGRSCTIVTTGASRDMDGIHDRMPVILDPDRFDAWLDPANSDRYELESMVRAAPEGTLAHHPVSARVGSVRNDGPELVELVELVSLPRWNEPIEQRLFD